MIYHRDLDFPQDLDLKEGYIISPKYSRHSLMAAKEDKLGIIKPPETITFSRRHIVEISTLDNIIVDKIVVRLNYDKKLDLVLVILLKNNICKTCWLNLKSDSHTTLKKEKYENKHI